MKKELFIKLRNKAIHKRIFIFLLLIALLAAFHFLSESFFVPPELAVLLDIFVVSLVVLLVVTIVIRLTEKRLFSLLEKEIEVEQSIFLSKVYSVFLYVCGSAVILWKVGVSLENITLFLGLIATGIAFAVRDLIISFFSWMIILSKKPFRINDVIKVGDDIGKVTRIGTFLITLASLQNKYETIKLPNKIILEKPIITMGKEKITHTLTIPLSTLPTQMQERINMIKKAIAGILTEKEQISVFLHTKDTGWFLHISYVLHLYEQERKNEVILAIYPFVKDISKKDKKE